MELTGPQVDELKKMMNTPGFGIMQDMVKELVSMYDASARNISMNLTLSDSQSRMLQNYTYGKRDGLETFLKKPEEIINDMMEQQRKKQEGKDGIQE